MSGAWGSRVSLAQRLAAQPAPPPLPTYTRQPDGSITAPIPLSLTDNLTIVLSLLLLSHDHTRLALLPTAANAASEGTADGWHAPSELLQDDETVQAVAGLLLGRLVGPVGGGGEVRVACVEHYPTLRQQWLRYTCVAVMDTADDEAQIVEGARWFTLSDVMDGQVNLASSGDLSRVLQSVTGAYTQQTHNNIPLTLTLPTDHQQQVPPTPSSQLFHLRVTVLYTTANRILLTPTSHHRLPHTHVDKGETLTFTVHRFTRALLGLPRTNPTVLALRHHSHSAPQHGLEVVAHVALGEGSGDREGSEGCDEVVEGGDVGGRQLRSYMRLRWYGEAEVSEQWFAGEMDPFTYACCQLAFSRMSQPDNDSGAAARSKLGVPAIHVEAADADQQHRV